MGRVWIIEQRLGSDAVTTTVVAAVLHESCTGFFTEPTTNTGPQKKLMQKRSAASPGDITVEAAAERLQQRQGGAR